MLLTLEVGMSDGPHRTLPMRAKWKALSERADNGNFTPEQVAEALCPALARDWNSEISEGMLQAVARALGNGDQPSLFSNSEAEFRLLRAVARSPLEALLVDVARSIHDDGLIGKAGLEAAISRTLTERALQGFRQVEEHYLREASRREATSIRVTLEAALPFAPIRELSSHLAEGGPINQKFKPIKRDGVDDGVNL
jgi:single-stranded DNA-specific DHH superfamily exonuclease